MGLLSTAVPLVLFVVFLISNTAIFPVGAMTGRSTNSLITSTPIRHLVIIFQENVSFDHYFATYPKATNPAGEPRFIAELGTLVNPFRLDRSESITCDMKHDYTNEQRAYNGGLVDKFVEST